VVKVAPMVNKQLLPTFIPAFDRRVIAGAEIDIVAASVI
jgi:hypothetical protein